MTINSCKFGEIGAAPVFPAHFEWEFGKAGVRGNFCQKSVPHKVLEIRDRFCHLVAAGVSESVSE